MPAYGASAVFIKPSDEFSHGLNERTPIASIAPAVDYTISLVRSLSR